jgi:ribonuclease inhibitor
MKTCILDGAQLADADAVYDALSAAFGFPDHFGKNPDALWDALGDYSGGPIAVVWRDAELSEKRLGPHFHRIVAVLQKAAAAGLLTVELK